jgi:hypothetical protein
MSPLVVVLTLVLLAAAIGVVARPLFTSRASERAASGIRPGRGARAGMGDWGDEPGEAEAAARSELEAAREAKYREIRDAELDYRTGKLSTEDYEAVDGALRAEAVEILDRLEALAKKERDSGSPK